MCSEYNTKMEELSLQIIIEKDKLQKLKHRDSVFTINFVHESRDDIIKFDHILGRTRKLIKRKINQLQTEYYYFRNINL